jgi:hypothetical protein
MAAVYDPMAQNATYPRSRSPAKPTTTFMPRANSVNRASRERVPPLVAEASQSGMSNQSSRNGTIAKRTITATPRIGRTTWRRGWTQSAIGPVTRSENPLLTGPTPALNRPPSLNTLLTGGTRMIAATSNPKIGASSRNAVTSSPAAANA